VFWSYLVLIESLTLADLVERPTVLDAGASLRAVEA
jgi:hypothetical protein